MKSINLVLKHIDEIICGSALITMITLVIINVFSRYLFNHSISWAEEVATICFVWCVFMGASATYKHQLDMGIDFFVMKASEKHRNLLILITRFILLAINGYIFVMAIMFTNIAWDKPTAVLGVSSSVFNSSLIVGFGFITFYTLRFIHNDIMQFSKRARN